MHDNDYGDNNVDVRADVLRELRHDPSVEASHIGVSAANGTVTLEGVVRTLPQKYMAELVARRVCGVREVIDGLEVRLDPKDRRSDAELLDAARRALDWHSTVPGDRVTVEIVRGWITLEGEVDWQYQRHAAADAVRNLTGAIGLSNLIRVRPDVRIDCATVKREIADAFRRSAEVDARGIGVDTTEDGTVILFGTVQSLAEADNAQRAAWSVRGVADVDNRLIVGA